MTVIRILGMILTLSTSTALGLYLANMAAFRLKNLLEFKQALLMLKSEIGYVATPLPEAMANISERTALPVSQIFEHFSASLKQNKEGETAYRLWLAAIDANKNESFLKAEDMEAIEGFGKTLGYLDKEMQKESIDFTLEYINGKVSDLQEVKGKNQRLYRSLGIIGGILLLVVFW